MRKAGIVFSVIPHGVSERVPRALRKKPALLVKTLALKKARGAARRVKHGLILGADTIVFCRGRILGKPKSSQEAKTILRRLSGRAHSVFTGMALVDAESGKARTACEKSQVVFRFLSAEEIEALSVKNMDKAGAYAVQEKRDGLVLKIHGDYENVVGLPTKKLKEMLRRWQR